jgi:CubicO group peptidase (beta-lactamase class C family)
MIRTRTKFLAVILMGLSGAALAALAATEQIGDVRVLFDGKLSPDVQANTFRHIDRVFPSRKVARAGAVSPLPQSAAPLKDVEFTSAGRKRDLAEYLSLNRVSGLLVLKDGKIALEDYELSNTPQDHWVSWSMVKSICSTLVGAAVKDGFISSLDDKLPKYLPELKGSAYADASVRDVLMMSSGVKWDETYTDPKSDRRHMLDLQVAQKPGTIVQFLATLPRAGAPGAVWNYSTGETHMIGAVLRAAVKRPLAQYASEKIWSKIGVEDDATWWMESPGGLEVGGSGFSARLRDYGRFGLFVLNGGKAGKEQVVPEGWFAEAGKSHMIGGKPVDYGYMWWTYGPDAGPVHQGAFEARGIFGQHIYLNPREHVVIVVWSSRPKPSGPGTISDNDFFGGVVTALQH